MDSRQALMLLVVAAGAFIVPIISERIGWFTAPCEMLYGILAANLLPWAHNPGAFITTLAQFGFLLLMFLAGLEIDFTLLRSSGGRMLVGSFIAALGLLALVLAVGLYLSLPPIYILLLGAVSISLLMVVLKEMQLAQTTFGQTVLIVGALGEFLTILEVTAYDLFSRFGVGMPLLLAVVKLAALLFIGYLALRWLNNRVTHKPGAFMRLFHARDTAELGVRAALAFMLTFAAVAVLLEVEQILATFIAGAVCSFAFRGHNNVGRKLSTMGQGFFIPLFFISVGMSLRLSDLLHADTLLLIGGLLAGLLLLRLMAIPLLLYAGVPWRSTTGAVLLLSAPLTLIVAIAQVGISLNQLSARTYGAVLAVAILSAVIFPLLGRPLLRHEMNPARRGRIRQVIRSARERISLGLTSPSLLPLGGARHDEGPAPEPASEPVPEAAPEFTPEFTPERLRERAPRRIRERTSA
jgi:Kef-type K+ transport system membrane component KefB